MSPAGWSWQLQQVMGVWSFGLLTFTCLPCVCVSLAGAAAVWSIVLAEHYKDATAKAYAKQVAAHLQHTTQHVVQHITKYDKQLAALLDLLPFARSEDADVAVQVARHAGTLIKLQQLSRATQ